MSLPIAFQTAIASTGTAQQLPANSVNGEGLVTLTSKSGNTANIVVGVSSAVTASTGYILVAGASVQLNLKNGNTNQLWVVGTAADEISVLGN